MASLYVDSYRPWPGWVDDGNREIAIRFNTQIGTYRGHADRDPGHDMTGDLAADFFLYDNSKSHHDEILTWFIKNDFANAKRLGCTYIITWKRIASVARAGEGIRAYSGSDPHTGHIHISYGTTPPPQQDEEEDMPISDEDARKIARYVLMARVQSADTAFDEWTVNHMLDWSARTALGTAKAVRALGEGQQVAQADLDAIQAALEEHDNPA